MVSGSMQSDGQGAWCYQITAARCFTPPGQPDEGRLLEGLRGSRRGVAWHEMKYVDYHRRFDAFVEGLRATGGWEGVPHPWFDVLLPESRAESSVGALLSGLSDEDVGPTGVVLICPLLRSPSPRPLLRTPDEDRSYLFHIMTAAPSASLNPAFVTRMLSRNRRLFELARRDGGTLYPIGAVPMSRADWSNHYGTAWHGLLRQKAQHDPDSILTPGPGVF